MSKTSHVLREAGYSLVVAAGFGAVGAVVLGAAAGGADLIRGESLRDNPKTVTQTIDDDRDALQQAEVMLAGFPDKYGEMCLKSIVRYFPENDTSSEDQDDSTDDTVPSDDSIVMDLSLDQKSPCGDTPTDIRFAVQDLRSALLTVDRFTPEHFTELHETLDQAIKEEKNDRDFNGLEAGLAAGAILGALFGFSVSIKEDY
jgi:hypothetical protein